MASVLTRRVVPPCASQASAEKSILRAFLKNPRQTGAIWASSASLGNALVEAASVESSETVIELGAGTGVVTERIQSKLRKSSRCVSFELDPELAQTASLRCPRVEVINADACELLSVLHELEVSQCDTVISGIPWTNFNIRLQASILDATTESMTDDGTFVAFAYVHSAPLPRAKHFIRELRRRFEEVNINSVVCSNIPPAIVYKAQGLKYRQNDTDH